jgi:hypothetical protein
MKYYPAIDWFAISLSSAGHFRPQSRLNFMGSPSLLGCKYARITRDMTTPDSSSVTLGWPSYCQIKICHSTVVARARSLNRWIRSMRVSQKFGGSGIATGYPPVQSTSSYLIWTRFLKDNHNRPWKCELRYRWWRVMCEMLGRDLGKTDLSTSIWVRKTIANM